MDRTFDRHHIFRLHQLIPCGFSLQFQSLKVHSYPSETEVIELQLLQSQNELLQQLLHNADISSSSEIEAINELKQSVEEQSKQLSQCQETLDKFEEALDNHETVENIDTAKKPIQ